MRRIVERRVNAGFTLVELMVDPPVDSSAFTIFTISGGPDSITINHHDTSFTFFVDASDPSNPTLMRRVNSDSAVVFAENIDSLSFTAVAANEVSISLVARTSRTDPASGDYRRRRFATLVNIRNL